MPGRGLAGMAVTPWKRSTFESMSLQAPGGMQCESEGMWSWAASLQEGPLGGAHLSFVAAGGHVSVA